MPPKVKAFFWRDLQGILPSEVNLRYKGILVDVTCSVCRGEEDDFHILYGCSFAIEC